MAKRTAREYPVEEAGEPEVAALAEFQRRLEDFRKRRIHGRVVIDLEYGRVVRIEFRESVLVTGS